MSVEKLSNEAKRMCEGCFWRNPNSCSAGLDIETRNVRAEDGKCLSAATVVSKKGEWSATIVCGDTVKRVRRGRKWVFYVKNLQSYQESSSDADSSLPFG